MPCNAVICDWNGTLFQDCDEEAILRTIAVNLAKSYIPWHPVKFAHILKTKNELEALKIRKQSDPNWDPVIEMFRIYNQKVLSGMAMSLIQHSVIQYAASRKTQNKIEYRTLKPIYQCHKAGMVTGILSSGFTNGIRMIIKSSAYSDCFDFYEANPLTESNGKAIGIELNVYKNKAEVLFRLIKDKGIDARNLAYVGDSLDDADCLELAGYPIVSFMAPEYIKNTFAQKYKAFVPEVETDLTNFLLKY